MKRHVLASFSFGVLAGCIAAYQPEPAPAHVAAIPPPHVAKPLRCWPTASPLPEEFANSTVMVTGKAPLRAIIGRKGMYTLIEEIAPGVVCILGEGAEV